MAVIRVAAWTAATACVLTLGGTLWADEPDWLNMPCTSHAELQSVDADGFGTFPLDHPIKLRGLWLHDSAEMLNPSPGAPGYLGGMWQTYIQTVDPGDFGGTALWMGQYIGKIVGNHPDGSYTDAEWLAELDRLSHDPQTGHAFEPGDLVEVRARAPGLHVRGKANVNEQHSNDPAADFDIVLIQAAYGLPTPTLLSLADVKDSADQFLFDPTRATGCERHQATLVRISGVTFVDDSGWAPNADLLVQDGTGRTFPVKLGLGDGFSIYPAPGQPFDLVAIFDQEDLNPNDGYKAGYRLWVCRNYDGNGQIIPGVTPKGDFDGNSTVDLSDYAGVPNCMAGPNVAPQPAFTTVEYCLSAFDFDADDVDLADFARFADTW